jgi:hypothetical protein
MVTWQSLVVFLRGLQLWCLLLRQQMFLPLRLALCQQLVLGAFCWVPPKGLPAGGFVSVGPATLQLSAHDYRNPIRGENDSDTK